MKKLKVLVCYGYSDLNIGDAAICVGIHKFLENIKNVNFNIEFLSFSNENSPYGKTIKAFFGNKNLKLIFCHDAQGTLSIIKRILSYGVNKNLRQTILRRKYDIILMNGGHFVFDTDDTSIKTLIKNIVRLKKIAQPLYIAKKYKIKSGIIGQSIGPIKTKYSLDILKKAAFILTREKKSFEEIKSKLPTANVSPHIDLAFFIKDIYSYEETERDNIIAVNLRKVVSTGGASLNNEVFNKIKNIFKKFIDHVLLDPTKKVCLFSQVKGIGINNLEHDKVIHEQFKEEFYPFNDRVYLKESNCIDDILEFYKTCDVVISTRYHGLIFSLISGTPAIGVNLPGVGNKIDGMFNDFQISDYLYDINNDSLDKLLLKYKKIIKGDFDNRRIFSVIQEKKQKMIDSFVTEIFCEY